MDKFMKALVLKPESNKLFIENSEVPIPESSQVLIKVHVTSITPQDIESLSKRTSFPTVLGVEGSGIVVQDSKSLFSRKLKGRKVSFMQLDQSLPGAWAEFVVCDEKYFMALPENVDFLRGATLMINPLTVLMMNERVKAGKHKAIIHTNAASDLGIIFIHWCHFSELKLISVVKSVDDAQRISAVSPECVLVEDSESFDQDLAKACDEYKPSIGFDFISGPVAGKIFNSLQDSGELYLMSGQDRPLEGLSPSHLIFKGKSIKGLRFKEWFDELSLIQRNKYFNKIRKVHFVFTGTLTNVYPISEFQEAIDNYQLLGENLLHFACDLGQNAKNPNPDLMAPYIPEDLQKRINLLPELQWTGAEYPLKVLTEGIYKGELLNDLPSGTGILLEDKSYYIGEFLNGAKSGHGRLVTNDYWYEGEFLNGTFNGLGSFRFFDGFEQIGKFCNGKITGEGVEVLPNGEKFEGEFCAGLRHGKGRVLGNGFKFLGGFVDGLVDGKGEVLFEDGSRFDGLFVKGTGNGELVQGTGEVLRGVVNAFKFSEYKEKS